MCEHHPRHLSFETLLSDPLIRLVMQSDGVSLSDFVDVLETGRAAVIARDIRAVEQAIAGGAPGLPDRRLADYWQPRNWKAGAAP